MHAYQHGAIFTRALSSLLVVYVDCDNPLRSRSIT